MEGFLALEMMVIASYHTPPVRKCTFNLSSLNAGNQCQEDLVDHFAIDWIPPENVLKKGYIQKEIQ